MFFLRDGGGNHQYPDRRLTKKTKRAQKCHLEISSTSKYQGQLYIFIYILLPVRDLKTV